MATISVDFWAGYLSGAIGIIIGNPLDIIKVRLQSQANISVYRNYYNTQQAAATFVTGTAAPVLGYGVLNALLFISHNRTELALNQAFSVKQSLWNTWVAGAVGGLATWVISTPTELIKCRAQFLPTQPSSRAIFYSIWREQGLRGLYLGGGVTALRDAIGYGFYFWSYDLFNTLWATNKAQGSAVWSQESPKTLLCGGLAGITTWVSVFPLDVIKTRVQTQTRQPILDRSKSSLVVIRDQVAKADALQIMRETYRNHGISAFTRGLSVCCVRAFVVNAVQWAVYEWALKEFGGGEKGL